MAQWFHFLLISWPYLDITVIRVYHNSLTDIHVHLFMHIVCIYDFCLNKSTCNVYNYILAVEGPKDMFLDIVIVMNNNKVSLGKVLRYGRNKG